MWWGGIDTNVQLSWNIVPNVYNSLQSSFLSLAWPWPGRSLPNGNQWEWWDPGKGPLPGLGEVGHSPRGTSGSAGTLDWGPMWCGSQSTCHPNAPLTPYTPWQPLTAPYTPRRPPMPPYATYPLLASEYLHSASPQIHPWHHLMAPNTPRRPQCPFMPPIPLLAYEFLHSLQPLIHLWHPLMAPTPPRRPQCPLMPPIPLPVVNCHHFATDHLHAVKMLIFYCCHFQLSSLCNWLSSQVHTVYKIPSLGVKNTPSVLWSSANFCSISKDMHYKDPVAWQHWKTNKMIWTWKDDWPPWRTSTYERPFTWEGNYLVDLFLLVCHYR